MSDKDLIDEQAAEIERLRAALERIAEDRKNCADYCRQQARRALELTMEQQAEYIYKCSVCGVEIKHDHDGNGCHACLRGIMRKQPKRS